MQASALGAERAIDQQYRDEHGGDCAAHAGLCVPSKRRRDSKGCADGDIERDMARARLCG